MQLGVPLIRRPKTGDDKTLLDNVAVYNDPFHDADVVSTDHENGDKHAKKDKQETNARPIRGQTIKWWNAAKAKPLQQPEQEFCEKFKFSVQDMIEQRNQSLTRDTRVQKRITDTKETKQTIVDGIWIGEDQLLFLTYDNTMKKSSQKIAFLEVFGRNEKNQLVAYSPKQLTSSNRSIEAVLTLDSTKRFAAIVYWDYNEKSEMTPPVIFIIDCTQLRSLKKVEKPIGVESLEIITKSIRQINNTWSTNSHMSEAERIFIKFIYASARDVVPNLKLLVAKKQKNSHEARHANSDSDSPSQDQNILFEVKTALLFSQTDSHKDVFYQLKLEEKDEHNSNHQELVQQEPAIAMFVISKTRYIIIYQDSSFDEVDTKSIMRYSNPMQLNSKDAFKAVSAVFTKTSGGHRLILQNEQNQIQVFDRISCSNWDWKTKETSRKLDFRLLELYDNMAVVLSQSRKIGFVELGGKDGFETMAQVEKGSLSSFGYIIDPNVFSFQVTYLKKEKQFTWTHFAENRYIFNAEPQYVQQICNGFLIRVKYKKEEPKQHSHEHGKTVEICLLDHGKHEYAQPLKTIPLPHFLRAFYWFNPIIDQSGTVLLLQFSDSYKKPETDFESYHQMYLVDLKNDCAYVHYVDCERKQLNYFFINDNTLICEEPNKVCTWTIERDEKNQSFKFVLKEEIKFDGISKEKSLFAVTQDLEVLAYSDKTSGCKEALHAYKFGGKPEFKQICTFTLPETNKVNYSACFVPEKNTVLLMYDFADIMYLQSFYLKDRNEDGQIEKKTLQKKVYIKRARSISYLDESHIIVQSNDKFVILEWSVSEDKSKEDEYKLKVQKKIVFAPSINQKEANEKQFLASPVTGWKGWLSLHHNDASTLFALGNPSDGTSKEVRSLNDLCTKMLASYKMNKGYAMLEENTSWTKNFYTVNLYHADFSIDSSKSQKNEPQIEAEITVGEMKSPDNKSTKVSMIAKSQAQSFNKSIKGSMVAKEIERFRTFPCMTLQFCKDANVWEELIANGIRSNEIPIDAHQLKRVVNPVISNRNRNMVYEFANSNIDKLNEVKNFYVQREDQRGNKKDNPLFYLDLDGKNALAEALINRDFMSFYVMLEMLTKFQNEHWSLWLVDPWLSIAIQKGINIDALLSSSILSQKIVQGPLFHNASFFPSLHSDSRAMTVRCDTSYSNLTYDEQVYDTLFGNEFGSAKLGEMETKNKSIRDDTSNVVQKTEVDEQLAIIDEEKKVEMHPIEYVVDNIFYTIQDMQEKHRKMSELLEALKNTEEMSYFRHGYIQRLLDLHWNETTWKQYTVVFTMTVTSFVLICVNASLLNFKENENHVFVETRIIIDAINVALIFISSFYLQTRLFCQAPKSYFFQPQNVNELVFCGLFAAQFILDIKRYSFHGHLQKEALHDRQIDEVKGENIGPHYQVFRIVNAYLVISAGWRLLNYAQILSSLAFMIKMIQNVTKEMIPFLILFGLGLTLFGFVFASLDLSFSDDEYGSIGEKQKEINGQTKEVENTITPMLFWVLRTSMGDFDIAEFQRRSTAVIVACAVAWVFLVLINLLIFLNFLIAVIGDVYNQIMETKEEESYRRLASMMYELELVFNNFKNFRIIPHRLLVTRQVVDVLGDDKTTGFNVHVRNKLKQQQSEIVKLQAKVSNYEDLFKQYNDLEDKRKRNCRLTKELGEQVNELITEMKNKEEKFELLRVSRLPGLEMKKIMSKDENFNHFISRKTDVSNLS